MAEIVIQRGLYFEEFNVGDTVTSAGRTITEGDIVNFAALSGDWNAIHVDAEYAKNGMFGERIAHGLLGLSIASGLAVQLGFIENTVLAFRGVNWTFSGPIKIGDTIRTRVRSRKRSLCPVSAAGSLPSTSRCLTSGTRRRKRGRGR